MVKKFFLTAAAAALAAGTLPAQAEAPGRVRHLALPARGLRPGRMREAAPAFPRARFPQASACPGAEALILQEQGRRE